MNWKRDIARKGVVRTQKVLEKPSRRNKRVTESYDIDHRLVEFCLNCKKKKCSGECPDFKRFKNDISGG